MAAASACRGIPLSVHWRNARREGVGAARIGDYFWQNDAEFERGIRFIGAGLQSEDHCVVFGHEEETNKAFTVLREKGFDVDSLVSQGRLTLLRRDSLAFVTLSNISQIFESAVRRGAPAIRFLGNLGMGKAPLPGGGQDDVLELEARVTSAARNFPCVVVCMYDVNTLPGRIVMKGGFETHPLAVCGDSLQNNPYYIPEQTFLSRLHHPH